MDTQFVMARWFDTGENEEVSRLYYLPRDAFTTSVQNGSVIAYY